MIGEGMEGIGRHVRDTVGRPHPQKGGTFQIGPGLVEDATRGLLDTGEQGMRPGRRLDHGLIQNGDTGRNGGRHDSTHHDIAQ